MSDSAGLGPIVRHLAIAGKIHRLAAEVDTSWPAGSPVCKYLKDMGEDVLPQTAQIADLTGAAECTASRHGLNLTSKTGSRNRFGFYRYRLLACSPRLHVT